MKKSKIKGKNSRIPSPFDSTIHKTEWTCAAKIAEWINTIVKEKDLSFGEAEVETTAEGDRKRVDIILTESPESMKALCVIEMKQPYFDPFDEKELKEPARKKAVQRKAKYFITSNFKQLIWFNTERVNKNLPEEEQIHEKYFLSEIEDLDLIEEPKYKKRIISGLENFLIDLYEVYTGKKPEPRQPIDEFLIFRLQEKIKKLSSYYRNIIEDRTHKDTDFSKKLQNWFREQNWSFAWQESDFDKAAHQAAYLLTNKILFYDLLQAKRPGELDPLNIPDDLTKGGLLQSQLQGYFDYVLKHIDYETIYSADFIDQAAFPEHKEVVEEIKELIRILKRYDFSKIGYDIIGRIFERLIPSEERHNLGQYFTQPDIVDLILRFCLKHEKDKIFDPACGAGTFLVRAYQHKKLMNQRLNHQEILKTLWGTDIAKFPAHLATINIAINDLKINENYPQILKEDFFNLRLGGREEFAEEARKKQLVGLGEKRIMTPYPKIVDCIVGNPPYTRHEEIPAIAGEDYKDELIKKALYDIDGVDKKANKKKLAEITGRAGIHAYFFVHGTKFLQNGGRFGFIVSNSWLDVDWGKGLQEFFLKNYKIVAIIGSKVERWFEEADINTCIVILEKCSGEVNTKERDKNIVRFVYLKKPLRHFIPATQDMWKKQKERLDKIDDLIKTILFHNELYENEDFKIFPKQQKDLWEEGFDIEAEKYVGAKWSKYLRAPGSIIKKVLMNQNLVSMYSFVEKIMEGEPTGANEFFFVTDELVTRFKIEKSYLSPSFNSPKDSKSIFVTKKNSKHYKLVVDIPKNNLRGTGILKYIEWGEKNGFKKHYFKKDVWYSRSDRKADLLIPRGLFQRFICFYNVDCLIASDRFVEIFLKQKKLKEVIGAFLNSTLYFLMLELYCRTNLGEGALDIQPTDIRKIPVPDLMRLSKEVTHTLRETFVQYGEKEVKSIFSEINASSPDEVSLDKVNPVLRELDKIIMGKILGLSEEEQLEVYRAVIDLVKSRIEKAKSFGKRRKTKSGLDIDSLIKTVMGKIGENTFGKFYKEKILSHKPLTTKKLPKLSGKIRIKQTLYEWRLYSSKKYVTSESELEARYLRVWLEAELDRIKMPKDKQYLMTVVPELENLKLRIDKIVNSYLDSILDTKTRAKIEHQLWMEILK